MSTEITTAAIEAALEQSGSSWLYRFWGKDRAKQIERIRRDLQRFVREYNRRFGEKPDPFVLLQLNPTKGAAFFQMDTLMASVEMKIMVWRLLMGWEISRVDFQYQAGKDSRLVVWISPIDGGKPERYLGQPADDFGILRHFGFSTARGQLIVQGFYAARGVSTLDKEAI